jgi:APA family basic amino acid/polyamine antiporter
MLENDTNLQVADSSQATAPVMPAEFGLGMAIFVVMASMVGVGVLTTSGYTMALVGSNPYMLPSGWWVAS